jgi:hypothetical protein
MKKASVLAAGFALAFGLAVGGCPHANTADTVSVRTARFQSLAADGTTALPRTLHKAIDGLPEANIALTDTDNTGIQAGTTALTLAFDKAITGLSAADITLADPDDTGIVKGELSPAEVAEGGGVVYTLSVNGIRQSGSVAARVTKAGYAFAPDTQTAQVWYAAPRLQPLAASAAAGTAKFLSLAADGGDEAGAYTTALTLTFDKAVDGLSAADITLDGGGTGMVKGELGAAEAAEDGYAYRLGVSGITEDGTVSARVRKADWTFEPETLSAKVYAPTKVLFKSFAANGGESARTTALTLTLNRPVAGLSAADIALTDTGNTGVQKGALDGPSYTANGYAYRLGVSGVTKNGSVAAKAAKAGWTFEPETLSVSVWYAPTAARFLAFEAQTGEGLPESSGTTALRLAFSAAIEGLSAADIALTDSEDTGITKGALRADISRGAYLLEVTGIERDGLVEARPSKAGYTFTPETRSVQVRAGVIETQFRSLTAESSPSLTLAFDSSVKWLSAADITLVDTGDTGAKAGAFTALGMQPDGTALAYSLELSGISKSGEVAVRAAKAGYAFAPDTLTARVTYAPYIFTYLRADGQKHDSGNTSSLGTATLFLYFDRAIPGLSAEDITLKLLDGKALAPLDKEGLTLGEPSFGGVTYKLRVRQRAGFKHPVTGNPADQYAQYYINVYVDKAGCPFDRNWQSVQVYPEGARGEYASGTAELLSVEANGSPGAATTALTLTFDRALPSDDWISGPTDWRLYAGSIAIRDAAGTGFTKGALTRNTDGTGAPAKGARYTLYGSVKKKSGSIRVNVPKTLGGWTLTNTEHWVEVYNGKPTEKPPSPEETRFVSLTGNGDYNSPKYGHYHTPTTEVYLTFGKEIPYLTAEDIIFSDGYDGRAQGTPVPFDDRHVKMTRGALRHAAGTNGTVTYTLPVSVRAVDDGYGEGYQADASVAVNMKGWLTDPYSLKVRLYLNRRVP